MDLPNFWVWWFRNSPGLVEGIGLFLFIFAELLIQLLAKPFCSAYALLRQLPVQRFRFVPVHHENQLFHGFTPFSEILGSAFVSQVFTPFCG